MPWDETILHVDMDAFFVEVERLRRPELRGIPVAVGGDGPRGVVAAASYEARAQGVRSALPMARARRLCPHLKVVAPDHAEYRRMSESVFGIFRGFTPLVEGLSLDEAFLDVTGLRRHFAGPGEVAETVRSTIRRQLSLPASVGVASTKLLAKLASEAAKPDGIRHVPQATQLEFLHALPIRSLWGVGEVTHAALDALGIETVADVAALPVPLLERRLGASLGRHLSDLAAGLDGRRIEPDVEAKSVSVEQTYPVDLVGRRPIDTELLAHADQVASRLRRSGLAARTISIKIRYGDFTTVTRSETRPTPTDTAREIHHVARHLMERVDVERPIRLVGVGATGLVAGHTPRQLDVATSDEWARVSDAVESVRSRFGHGSVGPARLLGRHDREE